MELPRRTRGDERLNPGALTALRSRLRTIAPQHDLTAVVACAFDHRTRMLPFFYADMRMAPAGVRAVGSALADIGVQKTRLVLQQWNPQFAPSEMRLDGRIPDLFMVSSMQIHTAACHALIRDACRIDSAHRPLIIAGGPKTIYEPWDVFSTDPNDPWGADVAVTGEEFVLLNLLEVLLALRTTGGSLRAAFERARDTGLLDEIPGLVYARRDTDGRPTELVDTGVQRLLGDLDELPDPVLGFALLEAPGKGKLLQSGALPVALVNKFSPIASLVLTFGCKFACPYCPIPAYNQRQHRVKSGLRIAEEFRRLNEIYGIKYFFGADDNFFNDKARTLDIIQTLVRTPIRGGLFRKTIRWGTEVTVHDTLQLRDHIMSVREAGVRALWLGVEDMTATFVKKGQSVDKTTEAFKLMKFNGICPMPMMMHHDSQPLYTPGRPYGLLNQVRLLRKAGAVSLQVLMMTPATGSKLYESAFDSGMVYDSVDGRRVETHMLDGNYVVASEHKQPWRKQFNIMIAYTYFYNPLRFLWALVWPRTTLWMADSGMQALGMWGLTQTIRRTFGWALRLRRGNIIKRPQAPRSKLPMRAAQGGVAAHALRGTPMSEPALVTLGRPRMVGAQLQAEAPAHQ